MTSTTRLVGANDLATDSLGPVPPLDPGEARAVAVTLAAHVLRHPCQLDPTAGVTECVHPAHDRDAAACRFAVEVFGVAPPRNMPARKARQRARQQCGTRRFITNTGVVVGHDTSAGDRCDGSWKAPEQCQEAS